MIIHKKEAAKKIAIIVFILGTGSLYFQVQRMPIMAIMLVFASIFLILCGRIRKINIEIYGCITFLFLLNTLFNLENGIRINDIIIWIINIFAVIAIQSNFTFQEYCKLFVKFMVIEALISLFCFFFADVFSLGTLPLMHFESSEGNGYYLTPYFTLGWQNIPVFHRNAGIYHEPGAHQIFLNIALLYLLGENQEFNWKRRKVVEYIAILIVAILTTKSTTGYMCLAVILIAVAVQKGGRINNRKIKLLIVIAMLALIIIENQTGVIHDKFEGRVTYHGSYYTRYNDTYWGYYIALMKPVLGHGIFQANKTDMLSKYGIYNISNGMASFAIGAGVVLTLVWILIMFIQFHKKHNHGIMYTIMVFVFYLMCINSEGIFLNIAFLIYLAPFVDEQTKVLKAKKHMLRLN